MMWKKHRSPRTSRHEAAKPAIFSMTFISKISLGLFILTLMIGNILVFAKSVHLSDNISHLEKDITVLRKENEELEKKMYVENSLTSLEAVADELGFTKQAEPVYFEKPNYAMAQ